MGVNCVLCDTGGMPVIWYDGYGVENPYGGRVPTAHTLADVVRLSAEHMAVIHG